MHLKSSCCFYDTCQCGRTSLRVALHVQFMALKSCAIEKDTYESVQAYVRVHVSISMTMLVRDEEELKNIDACKIEVQRSALDCTRFIMVSKTEFVLFDISECPDMTRCRIIGKNQKTMYRAMRMNYTRLKWCSAASGSTFAAPTATAPHISIANRQVPVAFAVVPLAAIALVRNNHAPAADGTIIICIE